MVLSNFVISVAGYKLRYFKRSIRSYAIVFRNVTDVNKVIAHVGLIKPYRPVNVEGHRPALSYEKVEELSTVIFDDTSFFNRQHRHNQEGTLQVSSWHVLLRIQMNASWGQGLCNFFPLT